MELRTKGVPAWLAIGTQSSRFIRQGVMNLDKRKAEEQNHTE